MVKDENCLIMSKIMTEIVFERLKMSEKHCFKETPELILVEG